MQEKLSSFQLFGLFPLVFRQSVSSSTFPYFFSIQSDFLAKVDITTFLLPFPLVRFGTDICFSQTHDHFDAFCIALQHMS